MEKWRDNEMSELGCVRCVHVGCHCAQHVRLTCLLRNVSLLMPPYPEISGVSGSNVGSACISRDSGEVRQPQVARIDSETRSCREML